MNYPLIKLAFYRALTKDIWEFLRNPQNNLAPLKATKVKVYETIGLLILKFVFLIPLLIFFALVYDPENVAQESMAERFSPIAFLAVGGFILPLMEESLFRLSLKFRPIYFSITSGTLGYYLITKGVYHTKISAVDESIVVRISASLLIGILAFLISISPKVKPKLHILWEKHFRYIFYLSCMVFAFIHISKYEFNWINILLTPLLTLPQMYSAIMYGYTRVVFGFQYPLLLHVGMNSLAIGIHILS